MFVGNTFFQKFRAVSWRPKAMVIAMSGIGLGYLEGEIVLHRCREQHRIADLEYQLNQQK